MLYYREIRGWEEMERVWGLEFAWVFIGHPRGPYTVQKKVHG